MVKQQIILFDGVCNLCNASVSFIMKRDKRRQFQFVALQSEEGIELIEKHQIPKETDSVVLIKNQNVFTESDAAIEICKLLPFPWNGAIIIKIVPKSWRDKTYRWIAKNRYRWFGKRSVSCHFEEE